MISNRVVVPDAGSNSRNRFIHILCMCLAAFHCFQISLFASGKCLESVLDPVHRKKFTFQGVEVPLTIAYSERISHRVTAQLTKILLEEGLGYDNVLLVPDSCGELCDGSDVRISARNCVQNSNLNSTSCIPDAMIDTEVWTPFDSQKPREIDRMVDVGSIGIMGRQGWYTTAQFVDREWTVHQQPADHWRALQLHDVMQQLYQNSNLITCQACIEDEFNPTNCLGGTQCVKLLAGNKGKTLTPIQTPGSSQVFEWVSTSSPAKCWEVTCDVPLSMSSRGDNGSVLVENQIKSLELNISMVWLRGNLSSTVVMNEALGKPFLFFAWDPDPLTVSDKFKRISFPQCSFPWTTVAINTTRSESMTCDFPLYDLHKFVWKPIRRFYSDIYKLVKAITLTRENIAHILSRIDAAGKSASVHDSICYWLLRSIDLWLPWVQQEGTFKDTIYIGGMFPSLVEPKAVWSSPGDEVGAHMAVQEVNNDRNTLPRFRLKLLVTPTQCRRDLVIKAFIRYLNRIGSEQVVGTIGPACSKATIPIAKVSRFYNTIIMGYAAEDVSLSDRTKFPLFYRTNPSIDEFKYAYLSIFRTFDWKHCASLREGIYPVNTVRSRIEYLTKHGIQVLSREMPSETNLDATGYVNSIIESKKTIIVLDTFPAATRMFICEAYNKGLTPDKGYVWFLPDWLNTDWWNVDFYNSERHSAPETVPCSTAEMKLFVKQGYLTLAASFFGEDEQNVIGGGTVKDWKDEYQQRVENEGLVWSDYASFTHDAVWTYALALDKLLRNKTAALQTIHSKNTSEIFRSFIQQTDFLGVSGRVHFKNGDRVSDVLIKQKFAARTVAIGKFIPVIGPNGSESGRLDWDVSKVTWASGMLPSDLLPDSVPDASCDVEALRQALGVTCAVATTVAVLIGLTCVVVILGMVVWILKGRYSSKYRDTKIRLRELGLVNTNFYGEIFALDEWEIPREQVFLNRKLGEGAFGAVFGGECVRQEASVPVAVKTLRGGATIEEKVEFLSEAGKMKLFSHPNLMKLLAVCTAGDPVYVVMELMIHGDLKNFLLARRRLVDQPDSPEAEEVTPRRLTVMALHIAQGLQYLAKMKFVHRDLALRNCMVGFGNVIKIGDFGLARDLQGTDYYRFERKAMLPVRWMSPESIREGLFTLYTDVWSYGVTLWELFTFGGFPYPLLSNAQVLEKVERGLTLEVPQQSSNEMKSLLCRCWSQDPLQRPKPETIVQVLTENPETIRPCLNVPATNLLDNSVENFDSTKPAAQARSPTEGLQSEHS